MPKWVRGWRRLSIPHPRVRKPILMTTSMRVGACITTVILAACGGGSGGDGHAPRPTPRPSLTVNLTCTPMVLHTSETSQCTASVEGTSNAPEWAVSSGTIDSNTGVFVAPQSPGTVTITVTARDQGRSASSLVEITVRDRRSPQDTDHAADPLGDGGLCAAPSENRPIGSRTGVSVQQRTVVRPGRRSTAPT